MHSKVASFFEANTFLPFVNTLTASNPKLYSPNQVLLGSIWGGPIAAIYYLRENFIALGEVDRAQKTVFFGGIFIIVLLGLTPMLPPSFPAIIIPLLYCIGAKQVVFAKQLDKPAIAEHELFDFQTNWRTLGVGTACLIAFFIIATIVMALFAGLGLIDLPDMPAAASEAN